MDLTISKIVQETSESKSFVLHSSIPITYKSGQFLTFLFRSGTGQPARRSYSISSSGNLGEPLTITVKRVINGEFSRDLLTHKKVGHKLITIGVSGFFVLPEDIEQYDQFIFFAAGSGISPIYSMIKTLVHEHPQKRILLVYSNTNPATTIFYEDLKRLEKVHPQLQIEFLFSQFADLKRSRLNTEVLEELLKEHSFSPDTLFYICGPAAYMRMIHFKLLTLYISQRNIKKEIFQAERIIEMPSPPDRRPHVVRLSSAAQDYHITVQYPISILQAAKIAGIHIPFSCESGQCGTCVATCTRGKIWMAHNEVLLDEDLEKGRILTCTGFPIGGDVDLSFDTTF